jgi:glycosidase
MFGGDDALSELITEAKKRGIGIILDGVFNHTGADSIYFNRYGTYPTLGAYQSKQSDFYGWYTFNSHPDDYVSWWGIEILPRINTGNPSFESFILDKVIPKYRDMGIAGMRLDVADELSDDFIKRIKKALSEKGDTLLYGEVWEDASNKIAYGKRKRYYLGKELDGVMNYPLRDGIIRYIKKADASALLYALNDVTDNAPKHIRDVQMNVLGTHDTERILTVLGGECAEGKSNKELSSLRMKNEEREYATVLLKSAYTVIATLPGIPSVFYADEAGLEGYSDPFNRMPYPNSPCNELLSHYRKIGEIRRNASVYADGNFELIVLTEELLAFSRYKNKDVYLTVYNNATVPYSVDFEKATEELTEGVKTKHHRIPPKTAKIFKTIKDELTNLI